MHLDLKGADINSGSRKISHTSNPKKSSWYLTESGRSYDYLGKKKVINILVVVVSAFFFFFAIESDLNVMTLVDMTVAEP